MKKHLASKSDERRSDGANLCPLWRPVPVPCSRPWWDPPSAGSGSGSGSGFSSLASDTALAQDDDTRGSFNSTFPAFAPKVLEEPCCETPTRDGLTDQHQGEHVSSSRTYMATKDSTCGVLDPYRSTILIDPHSLFWCVDVCVKRSYLQKTTISTFTYKCYLFPVIFRVRLFPSN